MNSPRMFPSSSTTGWLTPSRRSTDSCRLNRTETKASVQKGHINSIVVSLTQERKLLPVFHGGWKALTPCPTSAYVNVRETAGLPSEKLLRPTTIEGRAGKKHLWYNAFKLTPVGFHLKRSDSW